MAGAQFSLQELDISRTGASQTAAGPIASLLRYGAHIRRVGLSGLQIPAATWVRRLAVARRAHPGAAHSRRAEMA